MPSMKYLSWSDRWQLIRFDIFKSISIDLFLLKKGHEFDGYRQPSVCLETVGKVGHELAPPRAAGKAAAVARCEKNPFLAESKSQHSVG